MQDRNKKEEEELSSDESVSFANPTNESDSEWKSYFKESEEEEPDLDSVTNSTSTPLTAEKPEEIKRGEIKKRKFDNHSLNSSTTKKKGKPEPTEQEQLIQVVKVLGNKVNQLTQQVNELKELTAKQSKTVAALASLLQRTIQQVELSKQSVSNHDAVMGTMGPTLQLLTSLLPMLNTPAISGSNELTTNLQPETREPNSNTSSEFIMSNNPPPSVSVKGYENNNMFGNRTTLSDGRKDHGKRPRQPESNPNHSSSTRNIP